MKKILYFFMAGALLCSCEKENAPADPGKWLLSLKYADIADAEALYVATETATRAGGDEKPHLYKITFNGETKEVEFIDENGNKASTWTNYVMNLSDKFLLINLGVRIEYEDYYKDDEYAFVVRKSDGAMFSAGMQTEAGASIMPPIMFFFRSDYGESDDISGRVGEKAQLLQVDNDDNVYYPGDGIVKIYETASRDVFVEELVAWEMTNGSSVKPWFRVNGKGDVMFMGTRGTLCRLTDGSFVPVNNNEEIRGGDVFTLPDNPQNFYYIYTDYDGSYVYSWHLCKYAAKQGVLEPEVVSSGKVNQVIGIPWAKPIVKLDDCVVHFLENGTLVIYSETDVRFHDVNFPDPADVDWGYYQHSDRYIYSLGDKGEVIRFDPTDGTVHTVYSSLRYQIKNYKVYADDLLQFSGFDLQTGAKVIVQVKNGQEVILDKIDGREIIQMEQIN